MSAISLAGVPGTDDPRGPRGADDRRGRTFAAGIVLLFASIVLFGAAAVLSGSQRHSYSADAVPPRYVTVTQGESYRISIHGGVAAEAARGLQPSALQCDFSTVGSGAGYLDLQAESASSKATNDIATFTAPVSGRIHIDCTGLGAVFVDDADDAGFDGAGLAVVLGIAAFLAGLLALFSRRVHFESRAQRSERHLDEWDCSPEISGPGAR